MSRKTSVAFISLIGILCLILSCAQPDNHPGNQTDVAASVQKVIDDTITQLGVPGNIYTPKASANGSRSISVGKLTYERVTVDSQALDRYQILVEYDSLSDNRIVEYIKKLNSMDSGVEVTGVFDFQQIPGKVYVEFSFYFFAGTSDMAFMELKLYDDIGNNAAAKITEFSKDFLYDIINQLMLGSEGTISSGFDWKTQSPCEPDVFVEVGLDAMKPYRNGVKRVWQKRKPDLVTPAKGRAWTGFWIQELAMDTDFIEKIKSIPEYGLHELGDKLVINGFENDMADTNSYYVHFYDYPINCTYDYCIGIFWNENGTWYCTDYLSTDFDFNCYYYVDVLKAKEEKLRNAISFMLNQDTEFIAIYQQYCNELPNRSPNPGDIQGVYEIELTSIKESLKNAARFNNAEFKDFNYKVTSTEVGKANPNTKAVLSLIIEGDFQRVSVKFAEADGSWHGSWHYLDFKDPIVNGYDLENDKPLDNGGWVNQNSGTERYVARDYSGCEPLNVEVYGGKLVNSWRLEDGNGTPAHGRYTISEYVYEYQGMDKSWLKAYESDFNNTGELSINRHVYMNADKSNCYVHVLRYEYSSICFFYYYDGEQWIETVAFEIDEMTHEVLRWREITAEHGEISDVVKSIEDNVGGKPLVIYRQFVGSDLSRPENSDGDFKYKGNYIIELDDYGDYIDDVVMKLDHHVDNHLQYSNAGKMNENSKCMLTFKVYDSGMIRSQVAVKPIKTENSWIISNNVDCGKDFSVIGGYETATGKVQDVWTSNRGKRYEISNETGSVIPEGLDCKRLWKSTDSNENHSSYIGEIEYGAISQEQKLFLNDHIVSTNSNLRINGCFNPSIKDDAAYIYVNDNVHKDGKAYYEMFISWFDDGKWYESSILVYTSENGFEYYSKMELLPVIKQQLSAIGDVTASYNHYFKGEAVNCIIELGNLKIDDKKLISYMKDNEAYVNRSSGSLAGPYQDGTELVLMGAWADQNGLHASQVRLKTGPHEYLWMNKQVTCRITSDDILVDGVSIKKDSV